MNLFSGGQYGNRLLFASVAVNTTMVLSKTGQTEGLKVYHQWETFIQEKVYQNKCHITNANVLSVSCTLGSFSCFIMMMSHKYNVKLLKVAEHSFPVYRC